MSVQGSVLAALEAPGPCPTLRPTFLWWAAGQRGEGEVHDVTADDGCLEET